MKRITLPHYAVVALLAACFVAAIAACSDSIGSGAHRVSLSFTTNATSPTALAGVGLSPDIVIGPSEELVLKRIQLALDRIQVTRSDAACKEEDDDANENDDADENDDDVKGDDEADDDVQGAAENSQADDAEDDCEDISRDAVLINVPLNGEVATVVEVTLPAGIYKRLKAKLGPISSTEIAALGGQADMAGKSVRVEGIFKGAPFLFTSSLRTKLDVDFDPPLVVDASTKNATVKIDVTKWFIGPDGKVIDPASSKANTKLIARNIRSSFRAFKDDDKGGDDDK